MNKRNTIKLFKRVAEIQSEKMSGFGYSSNIAKMTNGKGYVVKAENKYEKVMIIIDRPKWPFHTCTVKKKGVLKL